MIKLENEELDFSFIYSSKCACSTLRSNFLALVGFDPAHEDFEELFHHPEKYYYHNRQTTSNYWFVRDPFDRFCSALKNIIFTRLHQLNRAVIANGVKYKDIVSFSHILSECLDSIDGNSDVDSFALAFSDKCWIDFLDLLEKNVEKPVLEVTLREFVEFLSSQTRLDKIDMHFTPQVHNAIGIEIPNDIEFIDVKELDKFLPHFMSKFGFQYRPGNRIQMNKSNYICDQKISENSKLVEISPDINQSSLNIEMIREFVKKYYSSDYETFNYDLKFENYSDSPGMSYSQLLLGRCKAIQGRFQPDVYLEKNVDLRRAGIITPIHAMEHFLQFGQFEKRNII